MIGAPINQDIDKYKPKFVFNITARECIIYTVGFICGASFFVFVPGLDIQTKVIGVTAIVFPFLFVGNYKPFGKPIEKVIVPFVIDNILKPSIRKKETAFPEYLDKFNSALKSKDAAKKSKQYKLIK